MQHWAGIEAARVDAARDGRYSLYQVMAEATRPALRSSQTGRDQAYGELRARLIYHRRRKKLERMRRY